MSDEGGKDREAGERAAPEAEDTAGAPPGGSWALSSDETRTPERPGHTESEPGEPTQAAELPWLEGEPTQAADLPWLEGEPTQAIQSGAFEEGQDRDGDDSGAPAVPASAATATRGGDEGDAGETRRVRRASDRRAVRILFWVTAGLLFLLVLLGLFIFGTRLPALMAGDQPPLTLPTRSVTPSPPATPTPPATPEADGPQPPGTFEWDELHGGECLDPFESGWQQTFTVVDCDEPHAAQLVLRGTLDAGPDAAYPSQSDLASMINSLCTEPGVLDYDAVGTLADLQFEGTYPADKEQWKEGDRSYYCFVSRASGAPLSGSVAGPGPKS